jgi:hypothetical protein
VVWEGTGLSLDDVSEAVVNHLAATISVDSCTFAGENLE